MIALEAWLLRRWYGGVEPGFVLCALAWVYARILAVRRWLYRRGLCRVYRLRVPVIVIGNLVAGGAGKTPLTIALATHLQAHGWRPGIVSRGHGRTSEGTVRVRLGMSPDQCGDEPLLMAQRTALPVCVDADRVAAAKQLISEGCSVIVADDGLQHCRLGRDIEIEVLDGARRHGNGRLLPAGPLREPLGRPVDIRVVNGGATEANEWLMRLCTDQLVPLEGGAGQPLSSFAGREVHAVAGIGNPDRFFETLRSAGLTVIEHAFPDHHAYQRDDLRFEPPRPVLMTEKDAVKCVQFPLIDAWTVPVSAELAPEFFDAVRERLSDWSSAHANT